MALSNALPSPYGVNATYWMLGDIDLNWKDRVATLTLQGFVDETARRSGAQPVAHRGYMLTGSDFIFSHETNNTELAYAWLKANDPLFAGATDLLE